MPDISFQSRSESDNPSIAKNILTACNSVRFFAFYGNLGAGKTTLIKAFCEVLGVVDAVTSPTFTLINEYQGKSSLIYHFDFYRIESETEAYDMGCDEYFDSGAYIFVEWPSRIPSLIPSDAAHIHIDITSDNSRRIDLSY